MLFQSQESVLMNEIVSLVNLLRNFMYTSTEVKVRIVCSTMISLICSTSPTSQSGVIERLRSRSQLTIGIFWALQLQDTFKTLFTASSENESTSHPSSRWLLWGATSLPWYTSCGRGAQSPGDCYWQCWSCWLVSLHNMQEVKHIGSVV